MSLFNRRLREKFKIELSERGVVISHKGRVLNTFSLPDNLEHELIRLGYENPVIKSGYFTAIGNR